MFLTLQIFAFVSGMIFGACVCLCAIEIYESRVIPLFKEYKKTKEIEVMSIASLRKLCRTAANSTISPQRKKTYNSMLTAFETPLNDHNVIIIGYDKEQNISICDIEEGDASSDFDNSIYRYTREGAQKKITIYN